MKFKKPKFWDYNKPNILSYLFFQTYCVVLDQFTKFLAEKNFQKPLEVFPFLNLVLVYNKGFAFGVWQSS
jgi:lipoprotein signal peptidase